MKKSISVLLVIAISFILFATSSGCTDEVEESENNKTRLTIACWINDYPLSFYVDEFNKSNSQYVLQIYEYYDPTEQDYAAAMSRMRVDLIANDVCDLLYLDSMDIYALENAGLLMDLMPLMDEDDSFNKEEYYWNIWSLYQRGGKLYEWIPAFELTGTFGPSNLLDGVDAWNMDEYQDFVVSTGQSIGSIQPQTLICSMLQYTNHDLIDLENGTCNLNSEEFQTWLEFAKQFKDVNGILWVNWIRGINEYLSWQMSFKEPICLVNIPTTQAGSICASAHFSFGISSKTENISACWDFLNFLMDDELLNQISLSAEPIGFPMKKDVLRSQLTNAMLPVTDMNSLIYDWGAEAIPITEGDEERLLLQIENIDCVQKRISALLDIVIDESEAFFDEEKSVEEIANLIQGRASIYLAEQS